MGADERAAVDDEGRRRADAEIARLGHVGLDRRDEAPLVEAPREGLARQSDLDRVADEVGALECGLGGEETVVVRPVPAEGAGAPGRLVGGAGELVRGQREVLEDEPDTAVVFLEDLIQRPLDARAVRSLIVGELHDRDRRRRGALDHRGIGTELRRRPGNGAAREQGCQGQEPRGRDGVDSRPTS